MEKRWRVNGDEEVTSMSLREREELGVAIGSGLGQQDGYDVTP